MAKEQSSVGNTGSESAPRAVKGGYVPLPGGCKSPYCKIPAKKFDFCEEHFDQFKFGLIKKSGEAVPDYDKKLGHYQAWKSKQRAHKVA